MPNLYDLAYDLEKALRDSSEFQTLKACYDEVDNDPNAKRAFDDFRELQMNLQQKQVAGQQVSPEEIERAQQLFQNVQQHEVITKLMETEQRMSVMIADLNRIITKPLEELYGPMIDKE